MTSAPSTLPGTRDKWLWPFASTSIWNMPIGSGAVYKPANLGPAKHVLPDHDLLYRLKAGDPERPVFAPGNWGPGRDTGTKYQGIKLPIPDSLIVPDATKNSTPNNCAAFLMPDGKTIVQVNPLTRTKPGGNIYGWVVPGLSIYGDGIKGGHGGSGLSSIGGTLRKGELLSDEPIRHALKVNIWAKKYAYYNKADVKGYRWPADRADSYAAREYGGKDPSLVMGSLLAIPPGVTAESLGLTTDAGRKLFAAFQDYGAYVVDDSAWDAHYIAMEKGAPDELKEKTGLELRSGPLKDDINKLFQALAIVDNNSPTNVGGGGTPRQPLAPPIGN